MFQRMMVLLDSIKFAHSIFALPFALLAMIVAANGWPSGKISALIIFCMITARSAAMTFNRLVDRHFDAANPRTHRRPTVTGAISAPFLIGFILICCVLFWVSSMLLNHLCGLLALPLLAVLLGYSLSKRFTNLSHFWLGLALGLAPLAAHLAVRGNFEPLPGLALRWPISVELFPFLLGLTVFFWVSGFDLIYSCQDYEVDRADSRLHSLPKTIGVRNALIVSAILHFFSGLLFFATGAYAGMGLLYYVAVFISCGLLVYEHWIVRPADLSRVNVAFFTLNGLVSLLLFAAVFVERVLFGKT